MGKAERATEALYGGSLTELSDADLRGLRGCALGRDAPRASDREELALVDLLVEAGVAASKSAAGGSSAVAPM